VLLILGGSFLLWGSGILCALRTVSMVNVFAPLVDPPFLAWEEKSACRHEAEFGAESASGPRLT